MRKIVLLFALLITFSGYVISQPTLSWQFANYEVINAGTQLQFDVEVMADAAGTFQRDLQVYFDYNTAGFGSSVAGGVTVTPLSLMDSHYFVVNVADNTSSKVAIITEATNEMTQAASATYFNEMPTTFTGLFRITLNILSNTEMAGITFDPALMNGGQYYQDSPAGALKYADACVYVNDLNTDLLSSLFGTVTYAINGNPIMNADIVLDNGAPIDITATDGAGNYGFSGPADGAYTLMSSSTATWGGLNVVDIIFMKLRLANQTHPLWDPIWSDIAGDVTADNNLNVVDLIMMQLRSANLTAPAWNAPDWVFMDENATVTSGLGNTDFNGICSGDVNGSYTPIP